MALSIRQRIRSLVHAWNAFKTPPEEPRTIAFSESIAYGSNPDRPRLRVTNERSLLGSILTRLSVDASAAALRHVRLDDEGRYSEDIKSGLNNCLTVAANIDQKARQFRQDIFLTLFDKGYVAVVPVDTTINPNVSGSFDIQTMRVGHITGWLPEHVQVLVYNDRKGMKETITVAKESTAIIENPLYSVMNETNSTLQRLIRKLNLLDAIDEQSGSGKLDILIQLPYVIKSETRRQQADQRRKDIEFQLSGSKYGIAYIDGTEKVTQLNRPAENNLLKQVEYLVNMLYSQLGLTPEVMNGTADQQAMINYSVRTIEPLVTAVVEAMLFAFLTKTARSQGQAVMAFRDPFKLVPIHEVAEIADVFIRGEIASPNDIRTAIGWKPSKDPKSDELRNTSMPEAPPVDSSAGQNPTDQTGDGKSEPTQQDQPKKEGNSQNGSNRRS